MAPLPPIPPRKKVEYKKPRRLNLVSVSLLIILVGAGYFTYSVWPLLSLRSEVRDEMAEALPALWKLNLRPEGQARLDLVKLRRMMIEKLRKKGIKDPKFELVIERNKKRVAMEARYAATASLAAINKKVELKFSPRVETDAERVDW